MQKINRDTLKAAMVCGKHPQQAQMFLAAHGIPYYEYMNKAATILLEITDPEFVPTDKMSESGHIFVSKAWGKMYMVDEDDIFRAMIKEVVE